MSVDTPPITGYSPEAAPAQFEPAYLELETPCTEAHVCSREQPGKQEPSPASLLRHHLHERILR